MATHAIDQEARDMASNALSVMARHEAVCAERWAATKKTMDIILRVLAWGITGLIGAMASLIAWLATHPPH